MTKIAITVSSLLLAGAVLAGCNTVRGVGADVERGGSAIQDAANDASN
ncbi:entericidin B [Monaibacterium marinum]|uniref:Entericidin B n=1 Tax=Pontivivens marinum TaxID=1690039 RepID=A0A2C9CTB5_9RHOB|nr:entericidin A/B family lipoprotein [Monaibacterium marinum]SOH94741.1 entericidin B [Monaibacterium marinum]